MKFLIVGLGNIGVDYDNTRHNVGFMILDAFSKASGFVFSADRYASIAQTKWRSKPLVFCKPSTYMNLSGKAVRYWLDKENITIENLLIITDDISLPLGTVRLKTSGSDGGHNGLKSINELIQTQNYARLRIGIGANFSTGRQSNYVLSPFNKEELPLLEKVIEHAVKTIQSFIAVGPGLTMNQFNKVLE